MTQKPVCIMLVDDNESDTFFHIREINKTGLATQIISKEDGEDALKYLMSMKANGDISPDLIFLDINMPVMNGWGFLEAYRSLKEDIRLNIVIVILTTSEFEKDKERAGSYEFVSSYISKPLTKAKMEEVRDKYLSKN